MVCQKGVSELKCLCLALCICSLNALHQTCVAFVVPGASAATNCSTRLPAALLMRRLCTAQCWAPHQQHIHVLLMVRTNRYSSYVDMLRIWGVTLTEQEHGEALDRIISSYR